MKCTLIIKGAGKNASDTCLSHKNIFSNEKSKTLNLYIYKIIIKIYLDRPYMMSLCLKKFSGFDHLLHNQELQNLDKINLNFNTKCKFVKF